VYKQIVVAYDGSMGGAEAVRHAAGLARLADAELIILTIYRHHSLLEASFSVDHPDNRGNMDDIMRDYARQVAEAGRAMAIEAGATKTRLFLKAGQPARSIVEFAQKHDADLIVVGSRGLGSTEGFLLGSVSHKIAGLADRPVLVV
jgi:nucleotide-binding universal stress UspA family protein